jgi:hypothetical protein
VAKLPACRKDVFYRCHYRFVVGVSNDLRQNQAQMSDGRLTNQDSNDPIGRTWNFPFQFQSAARLHRFLDAL